MASLAHLGITACHHVNAIVKQSSAALYSLFMQLSLTIDV